MRYNFRMINQILFLLFTLTVLSGCFNERGVSMHYYNDCEEYYDVQGYYHKKCGDNLVNYSDIKKAIAPASSNIESKVW